MTGNGQGELVGRTGAGYGSNRFRLSNVPGDGLIGAGMPRRYLLQYLPDTPLEGRAADVQWQKQPEGASCSPEWMGPYTLPRQGCLPNAYPFWAIWALHSTGPGLSFVPPEPRVCGLFIEAEKEKLTEKPNPQPPLPQQRLVR